MLSVLRVTRPPGLGLDRYTFVRGCFFWFFFLVTVFRTNHSTVLVACLYKVYRGIVETDTFILNCVSLAGNRIEDFSHASLHACESF